MLLKDCHEEIPANTKGMTMMTLMTMKCQFLSKGALAVVQWSTAALKTAGQDAVGLELKDQEPEPPKMPRKDQRIPS